MAFEYPDDLKYLDTHEYVRLDGDIATVGITSFAVDQLGDIVFLELPEIGAALSKGESFGTKAVENLNSAISGTVVERNEAMIESPEQIGEDPYGEGWLLKVRIDNAGELDDALSAAEYSVLVEGE